VLEGAPSEPPPALPQALLAFYTHCAACHALPAASPPGFLYGDIDAVERKLQRCAARIRFRLSMWGAPAHARAKVPMPPPLFVPAWEHSPPRADIERMLAYAARAIEAGAAGERGYETLPQCREPGMDAHDARVR
jgi:hypothetical protein